MTHREDIQRRIIELEVEHRDLDAVIDLLSREVRHEELQLRRLKKRKLQLKDHIMLLKMQLIPDIPAWVRRAFQQLLTGFIRSPHSRCHDLAATATSSARAWRPAFPVQV